MKDKPAHNDNNDPFQTLAAATARVLANQIEQTDDGSRDGADEYADKEKAKNHGKYVDQRLREIARFERRAKGLK